jgi:hypothetical protein
MQTWAVSQCGVVGESWSHCHDGALVSAGPRLVKAHLGARCRPADAAAGYAGTEGTARGTTEAEAAAPAKRRIDGRAEGPDSKDAIANPV